MSAPTAPASVSEAGGALHELRRLSQWVAWRHETRGDKRTKMPYAGPGRHAAVNNPRLWTTYERAHALAADFDGVGFVLTGTAYCGIDLDHCVDAAGTVEPWAGAIVQRFNSYTERSPSGHGLHVWVRGRLPDAQRGRKRGGLGSRGQGAVEIYSTGRYLTVTGEHWPGTPITIEARQAELDHFMAEQFPPPSPPVPAQSTARLRVGANGHGGERIVLSDRVLLDKAFRATNGAAFERLWNGDPTGYPSASEADAAFCARLAWWTHRDAGRVDRLFRLSGLMREKWDERRGNETYGARTVANACALVKTGYDPEHTAPQSLAPPVAGSLDASRNGSALAPAADTPPAIAVVTCLADVVPEAVTWLWPARVARGKLTVLAGDPGLGKSFLTIDVAARLTTGRPWPDGGTVEPADVVLLSAEDGPADTIRPRVDALGGDPARIHLLQAIRSPDGDRPVSLDCDLPMLEQTIAHLRPALVVIDPLTAYLGTTTDSYKAADVRRLLAPLAHLADAHQVAFLLVMHLTKNSQTRALYRTGGSIGFVAAARGVLLVAPDPEDEGRRVLVAHKNNLRARPPSLAYRLVADAQDVAARVVWDPEPVSAELDADALLTGAGDDAGERRDADGLLRELLADGGRASAEIMKAARANGVAERTLYRAKRRLGVVARHVGQPGQHGGAWYWYLPDPEPRGPKGATSPSKAAIHTQVAAFEEPSERTDETARTSPKAATSPDMAAFGGSLRADGSLPPPRAPGEERL